MAVKKVLKEPGHNHLGTIRNEQGHRFKFTHSGNLGVHQVVMEGPAGKRAKIEIKKGAPMLEAEEQFLSFKLFGLEEKELQPVLDNFRNQVLVG